MENENEKTETIVILPDGIKATIKSDLDEKPMEVKDNGEIRR